MKAANLNAFSLLTESNSQTKIMSSVTKGCSRGYIICFTYFAVVQIVYFINSAELIYCLPNPCQNGGNCTDGVKSHSCSCVKGFNGTNCENGQFIKLLI